MNKALVTADAITQTLDARKMELANVMPPWLTIDRFRDFTMLCVQENPGLQNCTMPSIMKALYKAAKFGYELGIDAHIVPFYDSKKKVHEATLIEDYKGLVRRVERSPQVRKAMAEVVYSADEFCMDYGDPVKPFTHRPARKHRGTMEGAYGAIFLTDGTCHFHYMEKDDLDRVKARAPGREQDTWVRHPGEMWRKTAIKNTVKYFAKDRNLSQYVEELEQADREAPVEARRINGAVNDLFGHGPDVIDVEAEETPAAQADGNGNGNSHPENEREKRATVNAIDIALKRHGIKQADYWTPILSHSGAKTKGQLPLDALHRYKAEVEHEDFLDRWHHAPAIPQDDPPEPPLTLEGQALIDAFCTELDALKDDDTQAGMHHYAQCEQWCVYVQDASNHPSARDLEQANAALQASQAYRAQAVEA